MEKCINRGSEGLFELLNRKIYKLIIIKEGEKFCDMVQRIKRKLF